MGSVITTDRFCLRELTPDDAPLLYDLHTNSDVMRYVGMPQWQLKSDSLNYILKNLRSYRAWGFGRWAVVSKESGQLAGLAGLLLLDAKVIDLGYRFFPEYWGKQVATETAQAVLDYGLYTLNLPTIEADVAQSNPASEKVLIKIGMRYVEDSYCMGHKARNYCIDNPRFTA